MDCRAALIKMSSYNEDKLLQHIRDKVEKYGACSIQQAAEEVLYVKISSSEQAKLARLLAKERIYRTEKEGGEITVLKNDAYFDDAGDYGTTLGFKFLKSLIVVIAAAMGYLVFHCFLPNLKTKTSPAPTGQKVFMVDSVSASGGKHPADSLNSQ